MPNKYSHSGVLAQYYEAGYISLPTELYLAYVNSSAVGSLTVQSQSSIAPGDSSGEDDREHHPRLTRPRTASSSSSDDQMPHVERGRARTSAHPPRFLFSHKPNPQDRAALISSFISEIDNEIGDESQPHATHQPHLRDTADGVRRTEPSTRHGVWVEGSTHADPSSKTNQSHRHDRNAWKSTYPPLSHSSTSSVSVAASTSSGEYLLDIPSDFPVHINEATVPPRRTGTELETEKPVNGSGAQSDSTADVPVPQERAVDGPESRQISEHAANGPRGSNNLLNSRDTDGKPKVPLRAANRPLRRQESDDGNANASKTVTNVRPDSALSYASVRSQPAAERPRNSARPWSGQHKQQKNSDGDPIPFIADSVSQSGTEIVDYVALSSAHDEGVKTPEHEAAAITHLPSPYVALPAEPTTPRQAPPPAAIGSNETGKMRPRRGDLGRPVSARSNDTQIFAPLSSHPPDDLPFNGQPAFTLRPNGGRPGSVPVSAVGLPPEAAGTRTHARGTTDGLHASISSAGEGLPNESSTSVSASSSVDIPSVQPSQPSRPQSQDRTSKYTPVYRDRKQEWLDAPTHSVGHYRTFLLKGDSAGHRRFASGYTSARGSAVEGSDSGSGSAERRLNSLPNMAVEPKTAAASAPDHGDAGPALVLSDAASASTQASEASSGFYPPDIPRYRDETATAAATELTRRREGSGVGGEAGGPVAVGSASTRPSSSGQSWKKKKERDKDKARERAEHGLLRRLRGVSLSAIR